MRIDEFMKRRGSAVSILGQLDREAVTIGSTKFEKAGGIVHVDGVACLTLRTALERIMTAQGGA